MVGYEVFLIGLLGVSVFTSLVTEGVKKILIEHNIAYRANTLAGIVATVLSAAIGGGYIIMADIELTSKVVVCWLALVATGWLCSMVGYDKVIQAIQQFKNTRKDDV